MLFSGSLSLGSDLELLPLVSIVHPFDLAKPERTMYTTQVHMRAFFLSRSAPDALQEAVLL